MGWTTRASELQLTPIHWPDDPWQRELRARRMNERRSEAWKVLAWMNTLPGYLPPRWLCHQMGLSAAAMRGAIRARRVRVETFMCRDGTILELVSIQDAARMLGRRFEEPPRVMLGFDDAGEPVTRAVRGSRARTRQKGDKPPCRAS